MHRHTRQFVLLAIAALGVFISGCRQREAYPNAPVVLICPWSAGGGTDRVSRQVAALLEQELGTPVNVVNATGGAGTQVTVPAGSTSILVEVDTVNEDAFQSWIAENDYAMVSSYQRYKTNRNHIVADRHSAERLTAQLAEPAKGAA